MQILLVKLDLVNCECDLFRKTEKAYVEKITKVEKGMISCEYKLKHVVKS